MTINDIKNKGLLLLECVSGSKAYGLDTPGSDTDIKGVYFLSKEQFYGLDHITQVSNETNDEVYYELGRFIELLIKNNPNMLELLATPDDCILYKHAIMKQLSIDMFLSKLCKESFAGYAFTQIKKARGYKKKITNPVKKERKALVDFCFILEGHSSVPLMDWLTGNGLVQEQCGLTAIPHSKGLYALFCNADKKCHYKGIISTEAANDVSVSSVSKGEKVNAYMYFNKEGYSSYCKEYREYWDWVEKRNENRFLGNMMHGKDYDAKNMMHTMRLLQVAEEIAVYGKLNVKRSNREELLAIKSGKFGYDEILSMAGGLMSQIEEAYKNSALPLFPDKEKAEVILAGMRNELYK